MLFAQRKSEDDTVVEMIASALRRDISFGALRPDEKLKIETLTQRYGGSNHSIRESLRMLAAEGIVEATNQRGFRVTSATDSDKQDILFMRIEIEKLALRRALSHGHVEWEAAIIAAHHRLAHADKKIHVNPDDSSALNWDEECRFFFSTILSACDSNRLVETALRYYDQSRRFRLKLLREGRVDFSQRGVRQKALKNALIAREEEAVLQLHEEDIRADML